MRTALYRIARSLLDAYQRSKPIDSRNQRKRRAWGERLESRQLMAGDAFVGIFESGNWSIGTEGTREVSFGLHGDQAVVGDWNGDGHKTPGVFRNGTWYLDTTGNGYDPHDQVLSFGLPGDQAVAGDWDGDGKDTVGVFRDGLWFFDHAGNGYDHQDAIPLSFGWGTDVAVPGDWNGDGRDTPGVYRGGIWALDVHGNGYDHSDPFLNFGLPGAQPFAADWNGNGRDTPGVLQHDQWFFDLEGDGFTGETGTPNRLGRGTPIVGNGTYTPIDADSVDLSIRWEPHYNPHGGNQIAKVVVHVEAPRPVSGDFSVRFYWSSGDQLGHGHSTLAGERIVSIKRFKGNRGVRFGPDDISSRPTFATHLIAVVNGDGAVRELSLANNSRSLQLPTL
ncbi:MAG: VCBS repeat-containing protein [Planctomycetota bacterium]